MALARWISVLVPAIAAAAIVLLLFIPMTDKCSAASQIVENPVAALVSRFPDHPAVIVGPGVPNAVVTPDIIVLPPPCPRNEWWGPTMMWLFLWGPICVSFVGAGFVAARHGGPISMSRGMVAASLAAAIPLMVGLNSMLARGTFTHTEAAQWFVTVIALALVASLLGLLGGILAKRHA